MESRKLTKEDIEKVRHIEGFPIAKDEDIIALSDAPYFTACPNPFVEEFIKEFGTPYDEATDDYHREPFAADVSEGKKDPVYNAHSYHTKVPYKAIMRYILHYTKPGEVIFDGFCGTGMTGVAAQMCGSNDSLFQHEMTFGNKHLVWGTRKAVISDLSPAATFISSLYNNGVDVTEFEKLFNDVLKKTTSECAWMYQVKPSSEDEKEISLFGIDNSYRHLNYTVYSDVFICPNCGEEIVFWDVAIDKKTGSVADTFKCRHCGAELKKSNCKHAQTYAFDELLGEMVTIGKQVPVLICYEGVDGKDLFRAPNKDDLELLDRIDSTKYMYWIPVEKTPVGFNTEQPRKSHGVNYVHQFFYRRSLIVLSTLWHYIEELDTDIQMKIALRSTVTGVMLGVSRLQRYRMNSTFPNMILSGTLYIGSMVREWNVLDWVGGKYKSIRRLKEKIAGFRDSVIVSTNSLTQTTCPDNSIDYIFTDPPFGGNLNYSELSCIWEAWLRVDTNNKQEAIMNDVQHKGLAEYQDLMTSCFKEYYRVLKPNRWITVEFHNSKNSVWNAIQESLQKSGFIISDVRTLDKKQQSFKQINFASSVQQDLVISAYKPEEQFRREIINKAGSPETAWDFVRQHLERIPVVVIKNGKIEYIAERQAYLLFDRMVAYHIMQELPVPVDASEFYAGLEERFLSRDGMYFLPDQVNDYDTARIKNDLEPIQFSLMVSNEKTAIAWLYQQLDIPQKYSEIQPKFMQEVRSIDKYEDMPELAVLLEENFLQDETGRWYIPDVTKEADVAKLREKNLLKEFEGYLATKGKLKLFRAEAIRVGFAKLWKDKNYKLIVETAERLPEQIIQEDDKLLMYYDISLGRV